MIRVFLVLMALPLLGFEWNPPGQLQSGNAGRVDERDYAPGMRFPLETAPAYPNSQVYMPGGSRGGGGGQCAAQNYSYPWWDNYCEPRRWDMPLCPGGTGHQGQDIRPSTCADKRHWAVAAEDGRISHIGSYSVYLVTDAGRRHRYLHMAPETVPVRVGQRVRRGDRVGQVSNAYFDSEGNRVGTTIHLHYDLHMAIAGQAQALYVPPYMALVNSYRPLVNEQEQQCPEIPSQGGVVEETSRCFERWGNETYWRYVEGRGHGGSYLWTNSFVNETPSNWARWNLRFAEAGSYAIEVHINPPHNVAQRVTYAIRAQGRDERIIVRQTGHNGWLRIATRTFAAGSDQKVEVFDNGDEQGRNLHMTVDALRVIRIDEPPPPPPDAGPPPPPPPPDSGPPPPPRDTGSNSSQDAGQNSQADASAVDTGRKPDGGDIGQSLDTGKLDPNWGTPKDVGCGCAGGIDLSWLSLIVLVGIRRRRR